MRYELTVGDLVEAVQTNLDTDPRFFDQDTGAFEWDGERVLYVRLPDEFELTFRGETINCVRF